MLSHFINESDHWRARAEERRVLASQMNDSESKRVRIHSSGRGRNSSSRPAFSFEAPLSLVA